MSVHRLFMLQLHLMQNGVADEHSYKKMLWQTPVTATSPILEEPPHLRMRAHLFNQSIHQSAAIRESWLARDVCRRLSRSQPPLCSRRRPALPRLRSLRFHPAARPQPEPAPNGPRRRFSRQPTEHPDAVCASPSPPNRFRYR